jgi:molybdopterin-synthase adenylyltransferase
MLGNEHQVIDESWKNIEKKTIAVVGAGGTGCFVLPFLAKLKAKLIIIDRDVVEASNLERQILYTKKDIGKSKAFLAAGSLRKYTTVQAQFEDLNHKNIDKLLKTADFVFDCTDNIGTRLLINDYCRKNKLAWVHTSSASNLGEVLLVTPFTPCYNCVVGERHGETCDSAGVEMAALKGTASVAVAICINYLAQGAIEEDIIRLNSGEGAVMKFKIKHDPECKACNGKYEYLNGKRAPEMLCGSSRYMINLGKKIDLNEVSKKIKDIKVKTINSIITDDFTIMSKGIVLVRAENEQEARKKFDKSLAI